MSGFKFSHGHQFINGSWLRGTGEVLSRINPATGELLEEIDTASPEEVDQAVHAATQAFITWSAITPAERSDHL